MDFSLFHTAVFFMRYNGYLTWRRFPPLFLHLLISNSISKFMLSRLLSAHFCRGITHPHFLLLLYGCHIERELLYCWHKHLKMQKKWSLERIHYIPVAEWKLQLIILSLIHQLSEMISNIIDNFHLTQSVCSHILPTWMN